MGLGVLREQSNCRSYSDYTKTESQVQTQAEMGTHEEPRNRMLEPLMALLRFFVKPANRLLSRNSRDQREEMLGHHHHSPLDSPRRLLSKICNKGIPLKMKKTKGRRGEDEEKEEGEFGDGGLWQKAILMGEKCQPPEFSGVIYYDHYGKRLSEPPRSPRASPYPSSVLLSPKMDYNRGDNFTM